MPHLVIEHSANLEGRIDLAGLVRHLHQAALATGIFPEKGTRTRAAPREVFRIADGHPDNAFVHLAIRIGHGRDLETRKRAGDAVFRALCDFFESDQAAHPLALSCEVQEIDPELTWKKNNLPEWIERRCVEKRSGESS